MDAVVSEKELRGFEEAVFRAEGFTEEQSADIADVLMQADLFGIESHGIQRLMYYHRNIESGSVCRGAVPEILRETPVSILMDAHFEMGQLAAQSAKRTAIRKAKQCGIGMAAVRNSSHFGIAGYYALMAEKEGLASFSMTNTGPIMVPTYGLEAMLGTNPLAFSMPADPYPLWFDASTTVVTLGKVEVYSKRQTPMPEGWTIGADGKACCDAEQMNHSILDGDYGGILPLGGSGMLHSGHKGYGLALMVEALTGVLAQGLVSPDMNGPHGDHTSHFFLAFDPAMFGDAEEIRERMSSYLKRLRESTKLPGCSRIFTPGEKAFETQEKRKREGIPVEKKTLKECCIIAAELGVEVLKTEVE